MKTTFFTLLLVSLVSFTFATQAKKSVKLRVTAPAGSYAETTVYFDLGIVPAFISSQDAPEVYTTFHGAPSLFSFSADNTQCSTNGYSDLSKSEVIVLGLKSDSAGDYVITAATLFNFDSSSIIQLEDRQLNKFVNLRSNFYAVHLSDTGLILNRFFLHVSRPIQSTIISSNCQNNSGALKINQDSTIVWTACALLDSSDNVLNTYNNVAGNFSFENLSQGDYKMAFYFAGEYVTTIHLALKGNYIVSAIQAMTQVATVNQEITFYTTTLNASKYSWDFGDSAQIEGVANPTFNYEQTGTFKVVLICSNDAGCQSRDSVTIIVTESTAINTLSTDTRKVWSAGKNVTIVLNEEIVTGAEVEIFLLTGQSVYRGPVTQLTTVLSLSPESAGCYLVSVRNNNISSTKKMMIL